VEYEAIRKIIQRGLQHGIGIFELTAGNSQYHALSYDEIKEITRIMATTVSDDSLLIAAGGDW
jgi:dihydrodipicolinate synthase/N-acetylneuraminate lyase